MAPYLMGKTEVKEISRQQKLVGLPCLDELFSGISNKRQRNIAIKKAIWIMAIYSRRLQII
jgi:hypothetical protein